MRYEDEHQRRQDQIQRTPTPSGYDDEDTFRVASEPEVVLDDECLERAPADEGKSSRGGGAKSLGGVS